MKVVLHIGAEKTGTTALQAFLADNRQQLPAEGYAYLQSAGLPYNRKLATYCFNEDRSDDHHEVLGIVDAGKRQAWAAKFREELDAEIRALPETVHTVIVSSEHFHSRLFHVEEIARLKALLSPYFESFSVVCYLRRQDQMATSLYSTALKCGHSFPSILPGVSAEDHYYNAEVLLDKWSEVFGEEAIHPRVFDRAELVEGDLLKDFLATAGIELRLDNKILPGRQNESLEPVAQQFLHAINPHVPMMLDGHFNPLREKLTRHLEANYSGKPQLPLKQDAMAFCGKFSESNQRVARKWFGRENLFSQDFSAYPEEGQVIEPGFEDGVEVASRVLNGVMQDQREQAEALRQALQAEPQAATRLIADYFNSVHPAVANYIRANLALTAVDNKAA
ncbi:hypothetical protein Q4485_09790 [Granulosicoccaceae sp. 1_MG-2023]|nr:hypothetical protein [Granulosicoccaceae sp. 1_MG-2023]